MKMPIDLPVLLCFLFGGLSQGFAMPTPRMSEDEMLQMADVAVEGEVADVTLLKRWIGDRPGIDTGYETGDFEGRLLVSKSLKGKFKDGQDVRYHVRAYMEGKWDAPPPMGFVYEGTQAAVTPGSRLRVYLKWNAEAGRYERVHFNSGFVVLKASDAAFPTTVGVPRGADTKPPVQPAGGDAKPAPRP